MNSPDNVGGLTELDALLALVPRPAMAHHKMDEAEEREIKRVNRFRDRVISNIRAYCATRDLCRATREGDGLDSFAVANALVAPLDAAVADVRNAIARTLSRVAVPEGMVLVPKEPTRAMCYAANRACAEHPIRDEANSPVIVYHAMLAASHSPEDKS